MLLSCFFHFGPGASPLSLEAIRLYDPKLIQKTLESIRLIRSNMHMNEDEVWMWFEENWWEDFMHGDPEVEE